MSPTSNQFMRKKKNLHILFHRCLERTGKLCVCVCVYRDRERLILKIDSHDYVILRVGKSEIYRASG